MRRDFRRSPNGCLYGEACVLGSFLPISASYVLIWSNGTLAIIVGLGLVIAGVVAWLCARFGKIGGGAIGLMRGVLPVALMLTLGLIVARHNLFELAGTFAVAVIVVAPSE